jgi:hypothetical protein
MIGNSNAGLVVILVSLFYHLYLIINFIKYIEMKYYTFHIKIVFNGTVQPFYKSNSDVHSKIHK